MIARTFCVTSAQMLHAVDVAAALHQMMLHFAQLPKLTDVRRSSLVLFLNVCFSLLTENGKL